MNRTRKCYGCKKTTLRYIADHHWATIGKWVIGKLSITKWVCPDCYHSQTKFSAILDRFYRYRAWAPWF